MPNDLQFDEQNDLEQNQTPKPLDKNQKIAVIGLAIFAVLVVILWVAQLKNNIYGPFNNSTSQNQIASEQENNDQVLKNKDTDGDGLNDYDELNVYETSPYLEDTDSDGFKDGEEIAKGYDPNCPQGKTCNGGLLDNPPVEATSTDTSLNNTSNNLLNLLGGSSNQSADSSNNLTSEQLDIIKNIDAATLRQMLLEKGMDKATLDKISDADLLKSFQEVLNKE